ncbi:5-amino-6-(5-phospho-D-ribitylamino)uracil phosphatase YigB [Vibrio sp. S9_S30]|uniref:5-amino-6-(5-phospho-D-ribitylamino)uracil phosphatase YigB n=1 Tax=Vibrio sp. S9_S30 TaxID=2720226 RepID=UPI00168180C3|nr:5-amino-6-(5-phospho-D-ribitylamino)uracil phosphatase YigB [Vibrio sp. S9_S30]MBD1559339.1 5-amino-6-(5-phospho-D-ribitylamino)uracil phosphatase YigB [Vibrio sp. S9_S30]
MRFYRSIPTIKAMTFDLDDTLYDNRSVILRLEAEVFQWIAHHYPKCAPFTKADWLTFKSLARENNPDVAGDVTLLRRAQLALGLAHVGYEEEAIPDIIDQIMEQVFYWRHQIDIPEETHHVLAELSQRMPLVAITNGNVDPEKIGLGQYFSLVLKAGPNGEAKPHREMFDKAVSFLGLKPSEILHVGDHPVSDVFGAKESGLLACWFNDQMCNTATERDMRLIPDIEVTQLSHLTKVS